MVSNRVIRVRVTRQSIRILREVVCILYGEVIVVGGIPVFKDRRWLIKECVLALNMLWYGRG